MKQFLFGLTFLVAGFFLVPLVGDIAWIGHEYYPESKFWSRIQDQYFDMSYGIWPAFTKGCTKDVSMNGHGWVFVNREYYQCGKISIWISDRLFGQYTHPIDPKLARKLRHNYRM